MKNIKIKESDLIKVIKNTLKESEEEGFEFKPKAPQSGDVQLTVAKGDDGKFYVIKDAYTDNPEIVYKQP
jgi:hypothetical protein